MIKNMKTILIVLPNGILGGAEQVLKMIAEYHMKEYNVEILFLSKYKINNWSDLNKKIKISCINSKSLYIGIVLFFLQTIFSKKRLYFRVYSSQVLINGLIGLLRSLGMINTKYFIARESTLIFDRFNGVNLFLYRTLYKVGYVKIDLLICQTELMKEKIIANLPWLSSKVKITVFKNPINIEEANKLSNVDLNLRNKGNFIVSAGRLIPEKGYDVLIKAFFVLKNNYPDYNLIILGEGKERKKLEKLISSLKLNNSVSLLGKVTNVYPYFKHAKLCVVSSIIEGFPNVLLQMMSQNTKVVSTLSAGGIENLRGVYTAPVNNVTKLHEAIEASLESDLSDTKQLFARELNNRSIDSFIKKINLNLHNNQV